MNYLGFNSFFEYLFYECAIQVLMCSILSQQDTIRGKRINRFIGVKIAQIEWTLLLIRRSIDTILYWIIIGSRGMSSSGRFLRSHTSLFIFTTFVFMWIWATHFDNPPLFFSSRVRYFYQKLSMACNELWGTQSLRTYRISALGWTFEQPGVIMFLFLLFAPSFLSSS